MVDGWELAPKTSSQDRICVCVWGGGEVKKVTTWDSLGIGKGNRESLRSGELLMFAA